MQKNKYHEVIDGLIQCLDCGASTWTDDPNKVEHHPTCVPGTSKKWQEFYEKYGSSYNIDMEVQSEIST